MSPLIFKLINISFIALFILSVIELFIYKSWVKLVSLYALLIIAFLFFHIFIGYPSSTRISFGEPTPLITIILCYISVILGMVSHYFYNKETKFEWSSFLKPLFISPFIFLPMIGIFDKTSVKDTTANVYLVLIAFENGFFWKSIYKQHETKHIKSEN